MRKHLKDSSGKMRVMDCKKCVPLPCRSGLVRSTSAVGDGEWLWVQAPSMVVGTPCRGAWLAPGYWLMYVKQIG